MGKEGTRVLTAVLEEEKEEVTLATVLEEGKEAEEVEDVQMTAVTAAGVVVEIKATKDLALSKLRNITAITESISVDIQRYVITNVVVIKLEPLLNSVNL